jgi:chemotaxis protein MotD
MKTWHAPVAETPPPARDNSFRTASVPATPAARDEAAQRAPETPPPARISLPADGQASVGAAAVAGAPIAENSAAESGSGTRADASAAAPGAPAPNISSAPRRDVEVTLQPSELGGVSVRMKSVGDRLELTFVAEKGDTARMIEERRTRLENQLRDAGLGAGGVEISVAAKPIAENVVDAPAAGGSSSGFSTDGGRADDQAPSSRQALPGRNKETAGDGSGETSNDRQDARGGLGLYL